MNTTKFRAILWGGWYGSKNVGDQALLLSISDLMGKAIENIEFIVITANPDHVRYYTSRDSIHSFTAIKLRPQFLDVVRAFRNSSIFIFGGGVPLYDDTSHAIAMFLLITLAKLFKVPYILWSVSSLPIKSNLTKWVLKYLVHSAMAITCRDPHSARLLEEVGASEVRIIPDSVFTLQSGRLDDAAHILRRAGWNPAQRRALVALTPRLLRGADGEAHTHYIPRSAAENQKEIQTFAAVLDWLWENGYQPIFVPMNTVAPDSDVESAEQIIANSKFGQNALKIQDEILPRDAANVYNLCQAAFVSRVHGAVTAFLGGCPSIMYAFGLKHAGIMDQMKMSKHIFDPDNQSTQDAVNLMRNILAQRESLLDQMQTVHVDLIRDASIPLNLILEKLIRP